MTTTSNSKDPIWISADATIGEKNNDQVKTCRICASNGYPHEAIDFEKVPGRILADGTNEVKGFRVLNYTDNSQHRHKDIWRDFAPKLWQEAETQEAV